MTYAIENVEMKFDKATATVKSTTEYVSLQTAMSKVKQTLQGCNKSKNIRWMWK